MELFPVSYVHSRFFFDMDYLNITNQMQFVASLSLPMVSSDLSSYNFLCLTMCVPLRYKFISLLLVGLGRRYSEGSEMYVPCWFQAPH